MDGRLPALADQLLLIERELRRLEWWASDAPSVERLASIEPFCVDTLSFAEWLQWIFLPRMKQIVEQGSGLPTACAIRPMAEEVWVAERERVGMLLELLGEFDRLINTAA